MPGQQGNTETLASMLYCSRATVRFAQPDLAELVSGASERNRRQSVTGALFYEDGDFLQWLEGPPENIDRLFDTISRDPRHSDIEVLATGAADSRVFSDWSLKLFRDRHSIPDTLHLAKPCPKCKGQNCVSQDVALELARSDGAEFVNALKRASQFPDRQVCYSERLIDRLTELWSEDYCGEAEIAIGKALALSAVRRFAASNAAQLLPKYRQRILVTSAPGEHRHLRAALATTMLSSAGYPAVYFPPKTIEELVETLYKTRYAGLVLVTGRHGLSAAQQHALSEICRLARFWSRPPLKVALYGRPSAAPADRTELAGADHVCVSARHLPDFFDRDLRGID